VIEESFETSCRIVDPKEQDWLPGQEHAWIDRVQPLIKRGKFFFSLEIYQRYGLSLQEIEAAVTWLPAGGKWI